MDAQLQEEATTILEYVEDTVSHICNEHFLSGEKVWTMINSLSSYKLNEFPLEDSEFIEDDEEYLEEED
tara:strand:+ start:1049 stop:1255 length:207 start_codon:yes stop_codon:yes gene_type:complete